MTWAKDNLYARPPIVEAVLELRFTSVADVGLDRLGSALAGEDDYRPPEPAIDREALLMLSDEAVDSSIQRETRGLMYRSADERRIVRVFPTYLTLSELAPYTGWEGFSMEALRLWAKYREVVEPKQLVRVGVRYINRLEFPGETARLDDYLHTFPQVSADVSAPIVRFLMNTNHILPERRASVNLNLASVEPSRPGVISILLDIDAYRDGTFSIEASSIEDIPSILQELRQVKNLFFEASITNRVREMIA